jgi:hypothetical protein
MHGEQRVKFSTVNMLQLMWGTKIQTDTKQQNCSSVDFIAYVRRYEAGRKKYSGFKYVNPCNP